jgi:hypothetical protein
MDGESVEAAFRRQHPTRGENYWFDLGLRDDEHAWVMPRLGGRHTEGCLAALEAVAGGTMSWNPVGSEDVNDSHSDSDDGDDSAAGLVPPALADSATAMVAPA